MKKVLSIAVAALFASSIGAFAQTTMGDSNMSRAQKDNLARTQSRPEIKNSETKPPTATTGSAQAPGGRNDPTNQSLSNSGGAGSGSGGSGGAGGGGAGGSGGGGGGR